MSAFARWHTYTYIYHSKRAIELQILSIKFAISVCEIPQQKFNARFSRVVWDIVVMMCLLTKKNPKHFKTIQE